MCIYEEFISVKITIYRLKNKRPLFQHLVSNDQFEPIIITRLLNRFESLGAELYFSIRCK